MSPDISPRLYAQVAATMVWYVAVVAIVNLALGYALAELLSHGRRRAVMASGDASELGASGEF